MAEVEIDPFELPDWLGQGQVLWQATDEQTIEHHDATGTVHGRIHPLGSQDGDQDRTPSIDVDLLAVDVAWPKPVCDEPSRHLAHEAWHYGQVALLDRGGRVTLAVPCTEFSSDLACEAIRRFSRAVGGDPARFLVQLRL